MAFHLLLAFLLATAATTPATAVAMDDNNGTYDGGSKTATSSRVLCTGEGCAPPAQAEALPVYGYYPSPPAVPSLPSAPPAPPSAPGSHQTPCPPVAVVCCGAGSGAGGQFPQQPNNYGPPAGGYVPYYNNASASPPVLLVHYVMVIACIFLLWNLV